MLDPVNFGPFVFDRRTATLRRDGKPLVIGSRGAALLGELLAADGAVVSRQVLVGAAWPDVNVEDGNLAVQVARLRKILGTRPDGQDWIATIPRVGYRLLPEGTGSVSGAPRLPSLAVLPFTSLGSDPDQDYFADGIVDDLITGLSRFRSFAVIARNSSFAYKGRAVDVRVVARELGVHYVVEGSVRRAGERLRVGAHLSDAASGAHLWAQTFEGTVKDIFEVQDRITDAVVAVVAPRLQQAEIDSSRRERPSSLAAYDLYLRGLQKYNTRRQEDSSAAVSLFEQSIALDPGFALALSAAASSYEHRLTVGFPPIGPDDRARSIELARAALEIGGDDATVLARCGMALIFVARDFDRGLSTSMLAVEANPHDAFALSCAGVANILAGDLDVAMRFFLRVLELNPLDTTIALTGIAHIHVCRGDYEAALAGATRALAIKGDFGVPHWVFIAAHVYLGHAEEALRALAAYRVTAPRVTLATLRAGSRSRDPERIEILFEALRRAGMPEG